MSRLAFLAAFAMATPAAAQAQYFAEVDDLPIPSGFVTEASAGPWVSTDGSRLVIMHATGAAAPAAVREFYIAALPALGWALSPGGDALVFRRGRERLTLDITAAGQGSRLRAELVQSPSPSD